MFDTYYLYLKVHDKSGMMYLGSTSQDPDVYKGSGKYWKNHLKVHGDMVTTSVLLKTNSKNELKQTGLFFSKLWNIVHSKDFANLVEEMGQGGAIAIGPKNGMWKIGTNHPLYGKRHSEETKAKISKSNSNPSYKTRELIAKSRKGKPLSEETKDKMSKSTKGLKKPKIQCPHCLTIGGGPVMKRFHFNSCKSLVI